MQPVQKQQAAIILKKEWDGLTVEYGRLDAVGEFDFAMPKNSLSVAFAPHDRVTWSVDGESPKTTSLPAGSIFVYGQREFVWHERSKPSEYVNLWLDRALLQAIATENELSSTTESSIASSSKIRPCCISLNC